MNRKLLLVALASALLGTACTKFESQSSVLAPSLNAVGALNASWASTKSVSTGSTGSTGTTGSNTQLQTLCTDFNWKITDTTTNGASGTFSATCYTNMAVNGTAQATIINGNASNISWTAVANGVSPTIPSCAIALSGSIVLGVDTITVPYSGSSCQGPLSGTEVLKKG